jgi:hypothetical protein
VTRLVEKPFSEKLEALYKSRAYQLAVAVGQTEQVPVPPPRLSCLLASAPAASAACLLVLPVLGSKVGSWQLLAPLARGLVASLLAH